MSLCSGNKEDHCCYLGKHGVCKFLEENTVPGRRWACGIRKKYDSWQETYQDSDYIQDVKPILIEIDVPDCGDWPRQNETCTICGVVG